LYIPIILLCYEWMKRHDSRGNPTYTHDKAGFLLMNFFHKLPQMSEPFIFSSQATQVFFSNVPQKPSTGLQEQSLCLKEFFNFFLINTRL
jgi:hypothetical protein